MFFSIRNYLILNWNLVDENEETNIENLKLKVYEKIITPDKLRELDEEYFLNILNCFAMFVKFIGRICAERIIISLA